MPKQQRAVDAVIGRALGGDAVSSRALGDVAGAGTDAGSVWT
eukprot:gene4210-2032_t